MKQINPNQNFDQNIERLIVRSLDSDLNEQEQLELNRELIRNPDAREMLEQYQRVDRLAVEALDQVIGETSADVCETITETQVQTFKMRKFNRGWLMIPGAIAAAIMAIAIPRISFDQAQPQAVKETLVANQPANQPTLTTLPYIRPTVGSNTMMNAGNNMDQNSLMRQASYPRTRRNTGREMLGVMGDDGKIYWIEVDRIRTIRQNRPTLGSRNLNEM